MIRVMGFVFFFHCFAYASINVEAGSYEERFTDLTTVIDGTQVEIYRSYSSASEFQGEFGRGWCSPLDAKLIFSKAGVYYAKCGSESAVLFEPAGKTTWKMVGRPGTRIAKKGSEYSLGWGDGKKDHFDKTGRLLRIETNLNEVVHFRYAKGKVSAIEVGGKKIKISRDSNGHVKQISTPSGQKVEYTFKQGQVASVKNYEGDHIKYAHDYKGRLTELSFSDNTNRSVSYSQDGFVRTYKDRINCLENYVFRVNTKKLTSNVRMTRNCPGKDEIVETFAYKFAKTPNGYRIAQAKIDRSGQVTTFKNDPKTDRWLEVSKPGGKFVQKVDSKGRVVAKTVDGRKYKYSYDKKCDLPNRVDFSGKTSQTYRFKYTSKCQVREAKEGKVALSFLRDQRGRVTEIQNQKGQKVKLSYSGNGIKPTRAEAPGMGVVTYAYDEIGKLKELNYKSLAASLFSARMMGQMDQLIKWSRVEESPQ